MNKLSGFSLLELTIAMSIIGLLVAVVITGGNLKHKLEINKIIEDIGLISLAVKAFQDEKNRLPGDMYDAESKFGAAETDDGNGDNDLGVSEGLDTNQNETLLFWQHLSLAGLIGGSYDGATDGADGRMQGALKNSIYGAAKASGGLLNISVSKFSVATPAGGLGLFSTKEAYALDFKYDDGDPETGNIQGADGSDAAAADCVTGTSPNLSYNLATTDDAPCILNFYIEQQNLFM